MTRVPVATVSRYATPRNSRNVSFASVVAEGATMPSTEPSSVTALARKSGWAQVSARLVRVPTLNSTPTSPSGAMTGSPARAPLPRPTPRSRVRSEVGPLWRSTGAGRGEGGDRGAGGQSEPRREPVVFRAQGGQRARLERHRVALGLDRTEPRPAGPALRGQLLQPEERHQRRVAQPFAQPETEPRGERDRAYREEEAEQKQEGIAP